MEGKESKECLDKNQEISIFEYDEWKLPSTILINTRSGINIGQMMRTSYVLGLENFYYYDPESAWLDETQVNAIRRYSRGAVDSPTIQKVDGDIKRFLKNYKGRKIVTALSETAVPLYKFEFKENDLVIFGNEILGIPQDLVDISDAQVIIPMRRFQKSVSEGGALVKSMGMNTIESDSPCYSVSHAFAMVGYAIISQFCQEKSINGTWKYGEWTSPHSKSNITSENKKRERQEQSSQKTQRDKMTPQNKTLPEDKTSPKNKILPKK